MLLSSRDWQFHIGVTEALLLIEERERENERLLEINEISYLIIYAHFGRVKPRVLLRLSPSEVKSNVSTGGGKFVNKRTTARLSSVSARFSSRRKIDTPIRHVPLADDLHSRVSRYFYLSGRAGREEGLKRKAIKVGANYSSNERSEIALGAALSLFRSPGNDASILARAINFQRK